MTNLQQALSSSQAVVAQQAGVPPNAISLAATPLKGGTEAELILLLTARYRDALGRQRAKQIVVKQLSGRAVREAAVYRALRERRARLAAPNLLALVPSETGSTGGVVATCPCAASTPLIVGWLIPPSTS
jgi:hypothetical protein